jgi:uncharacterized protein with PIN domain|tara:strand:+ start:4294 stop:4641 length:348 start_codon:yes stop_codon:yes gene_type:complete
MRTDEEILAEWPYKDGVLVPIGSKPIEEKDMEVRASNILVEVLLDIRRAVVPEEKRARCKQCGGPLEGTELGTECGNCTEEALLKRKGWNVCPKCSKWFQGEVCPRGCSKQTEEE